MLGPLVVYIQRWKMHKRGHYLSTSHRCRRSFSKACRKPKASPRTTSQSSLDLHEDRDLKSMLSLEISHQSLFPLPLKPKNLMSNTTYKVRLTNLPIRRQ